MNTNEIKPRSSGLVSSKWMFALCFLVYSAVYIARGNFAYARSTMVAEGVIDVGLAGIMSAVYFGCYALGQLINGAAADKKPPFLLVGVGLFIITLTNASMMLELPAALRIAVWAVNGLGQSMLWCPVFYIISNVLHEKVRFVAVTVIILATPLGKASCAWLSGWAVGSGRWQNVFLMASSVIFAVLILWIAGILTFRKNLVVPQKIKRTSETCEEKTVKLLPLLGRSGVLLMLPAMLVYGLFFNGVVELIPTILSKEYEMTAAAAAWLDSLIPILGSVGVLAANAVYIKLFKKNEIKSALAVMSASIVPMLVMLALTLGKGQGYVFGKFTDSILFVVIYGLVYIFQLSFGHFCVSLVPMRFSKFAFAATVSGVANAVGYGGSAIASYVMSYTVDRLPLWQTVVIWLACLAAASVALSLSLVKWNKFRAAEEIS